MRAEIEAIRSGNEASDRYALCLLFIKRASDQGNSMKSFESQVVALEVEVERLSDSLETQRLAAVEAQTQGNRRVEEISREVNKKVTKGRLRLMVVTYLYTGCGN